MSSVAASYIDDGALDVAPVPDPLAPKATPRLNRTKRLPTRSSENRLELTTTVRPPSECSAIDDSYSVVSTTATYSEAAEEATQHAKQESFVHWKAESDVQSFIDDGVPTSGQALARTETKTLQRESNRKQSVAVPELPKPNPPVHRASASQWASGVPPVQARRALLDSTIATVNDVDRTVSRLRVQGGPVGIRTSSFSGLPTFIVRDKTGSTAVVNSADHQMIPQGHPRAHWRRPPLKIDTTQRAKKQPHQALGARNEDGPRASSAPVPSPTKATSPAPSAKPPTAPSKAPPEAPHASPRPEPPGTAAAAPVETPQDEPTAPRPSANPSTASPPPPSATAPSKAPSEAPSPAPSNPDAPHAMSGALQPTPAHLPEPAAPTLPLPPDPATAPAPPLWPLAAVPPPHPALVTPTPPIPHPPLHPDASAPPPPPPLAPAHPSSYRAPYVSSAASTTTSSSSSSAGGASMRSDPASEGGGYVALPRRVVEQPYCNAVRRGVPVRMAEWRVQGAGRA